MGIRWVCWQPMITLWGRYFADGIFKPIFVNEKLFHFDLISLKVFCKGLISNIRAFVQIMACCPPNRRHVIIWTNKKMVQFTAVFMRHPGSIPVRRLLTRLYGTWLTIICAIHLHKMRALWMAMGSYHLDLTVARCVKRLHTFDLHGLFCVCAQPMRDDVTL